MFNVRMAVQGDRFYVKTDQPHENLILETLAEMRKADPMKDREGLGRWALSIPMVRWVELRRKYPELASPDAQVKSRAYARFMASDESIPYRVRAKI